MSWLQLIIEAPADTAEALSESLAELGAEAVTFSDAADQPLFEPPLGTTPLWTRTQITALYGADAPLEQISQQLSQRHPQVPLQARIEALVDQDWTRAWMDRFQPMQFGQRLWICPSWHSPPDPEAVNLLLDPGLAFGTGTHETTALCLQWLEAADLSQTTVIDYGCGSGVLAIAALKLGAKHAIGVDNDPQALLASRDNAQRNGISEQQLSLYLPQQLPNDCQAELVIANILAHPLIQLAPHLCQCLAPQGQLVLSGILANQAEAVQAAYTAEIDFLPAAHHNDWLRLQGKKRG